MTGNIILTRMKDWFLYKILRETLHGWSVEPELNKRRKCEIGVRARDPSTIPSVKRPFRTQPCRHVTLNVDADTLKGRSSGAADYVTNEHITKRNARACATR